MSYVSELSKSFDSSTRITRWQDNMWMSKLHASKMRSKPLLATVVIVDEKHRGHWLCKSSSSLFWLCILTLFLPHWFHLRKIIPYQLLLKPLPTAQALCSSTLWPFPFKLLAFFHCETTSPWDFFCTTGTEMDQWLIDSLFKTSCISHGIHLCCDDTLLYLCPLNSLNANLGNYFLGIF